MANLFFYPTGMVEMTFLNKFVLGMVLFVVFSMGLFCIYLSILSETKRIGNNGSSKLIYVKTI